MHLGPVTMIPLTSSTLLKDVLQQHGCPFGELNRVTQPGNADESLPDHSLPGLGQSGRGQLKGTPQRLFNACPDAMPYEVLDGCLQLDSSQISTDHVQRANASKACELPQGRQVPNELDSADAWGSATSISSTRNWETFLTCQHSAGRAWSPLPAMHHGTTGTSNGCHTHGAAPVWAQCESHPTSCSPPVDQISRRATPDVIHFAPGASCVHQLSNSDEEPQDHGIPGGWHSDRVRLIGTSQRQVSACPDDMPYEALDGLLQLGSSQISSDDAQRAKASKECELPQHRQVQCESHPASCSPHVGQISCRATREVIHSAPRASSVYQLRAPIEQGSSQDLYRPRGPPKGKVTTMMIRNIPAQFTMWRFVNEIDNQGFEGLYDYYYQPMDYQTRSQRDFAFVNFVSANIAETFRILFHGKVLFPYKCKDEPLTVLPALEQGLEANAVRYFTRKAQAHKKGMRSCPIFPKVDYSRFQEAEARARAVVANVPMAPASTVAPPQDAARQHLVHTGFDIPDYSVVPNTSHNETLTRARPEFATYPDERFTADSLYEYKYCSACGFVTQLCSSFCPQCGESCQSTPPSMA